MTCKDCVHYKPCFYANIDTCGMFKDKSKFIELPCKVGDTVYVICGWVSEYKVERLEYDGVFIWAELVNESYNAEDRTTKRCISFDLNKTVFLTREAAEAALKEREQSE